MKRRFLIPFFVAAFALALGGCKKKEEGGEGEPAAAKPAEGDKKEEAQKEEPKEEAKEEAKEEGGGDAKTGVAECDAYVAAVTKYVECDKVPEQARDATKQGLDQMQKAWSQWGDDVPEETKKAAGDGCKTALDALKKGAEAIGCPIE